MVLLLSTLFLAKACIYLFESIEIDPIETKKKHKDLT